MNHDGEKTESRASEWRVGDVILDLYEVTGLLGEGGMGRVYKVHHRGWDIDLAVKTPRPDILDTPRGVESFVREAETWVNLGLHAHTVNCYYVRPIDRIPRVFVEYVDGGSLADWIQTKKLYEGGAGDALERILDIAIQLARGLRHAHDQGLVHQDIKPANVMMTAGGVAKVTDFGLARAGAAAPERPRGVNILVSTAGMTPAYCSPEQAARRPLTPKTDMWSWGLSVLQMFTGEVTWLAGQAAPDALEGYLEAHREGAGESPAPAMPQTVIAVLRHCFSQNPDDRPPDMREIDRTLRSAYSSACGRVYPRERPRTATETAGDLNNRAVSLLDLGRADALAALWDRALAADPKHPESIYNRGLWMWRSKKMTDAELIASLESIGTMSAKTWLAEVLLECGDAPRADKLLAEVRAANDAKDSHRLGRLTRLARSGDISPTVRKSNRVLDFVNHLAFSRNGATLLVAGRLFRWTGRNAQTGFPTSRADYVIELWDWSSHTLRRRISVEANHSAVALSPDDRRVLAASGSKVTLWDIASAKQIALFEEPNATISTVCMLPDGRSVLLGTEAGNLALWDIVRGQRRYILRGHAGTVSRLCVSHDGRHAFSAANGEACVQWDLATGWRVRDFGVSNGEMALSHNGHLLAISSSGSITLWPTDASNGAAVVTGRFSGDVLGFLPGDQRLVSLQGRGSDVSDSLPGRSRELSLHLWEVASGARLSTIAFGRLGDPSIGSQDPAVPISLSPCGRFVALPYEVYTLPRFAPDARAQPAIAQVATQITLDANSRQADTLVEEATRLMNCDDYVQALRLARALRDMPGFERAPKTLDLWSQLTRRCRRLSLRETWRVRTFDNADIVRFGPQGQFLIAKQSTTGSFARGAEGQAMRSPSAPGRISLVTRDGGTRWEKEWPVVRDVAMSRDGRVVLVAGETVELWSANDGKLLRECDGSRGMTGVHFAADGRRVVGMGLSAEIVSLWDAATGERLRCWRRGHELPSKLRWLSAGVGPLAVSAVGLCVVSGSDGPEPLRLWNIESDGQAAALGDNGLTPMTVAWSPHGRWIAVAGSRKRDSTDVRPMLVEEDDVIECWDVQTFERSSSFTWQGTGGICITPDAGWILVCAQGEVVRFLDVAGRLRPAEIRVGEGVSPTELTLSPDGRWLATTHHTKTGSRVEIWELDWDLAACDPADWDEGARPWLQGFLTLHTTPLGQRPQWTEQDFDQLLIDLQRAGYGWLRPEGVRRKLDEMPWDVQPAASATSQQVGASGMSRFLGMLRGKWR